MSDQIWKEPLGLLQVHTALTIHERVDLAVIGGYLTASSTQLNDDLQLVRARQFRDVHFTISNQPEDDGGARQARAIVQRIVAEQSSSSDRFDDSIGELLRMLQGGMLRGGEAAENTVYVIAVDELISALGRSNATADELTIALHDLVVEFDDKDDLVPVLMGMGANAAARERRTHRLAHATVLARGRTDLERNNSKPDGGVEVASDTQDSRMAPLVSLFSGHCEIDSYIAALLRDDPAVLHLVATVLEQLASSGWRRPADQATVLHTIVEDCRRLSLDGATATALAKRVLRADPGQLRAQTSARKTPGDIALLCDDAKELERLLTVTVFGSIQLLHPGKQLYRSPTALVLDCRDLATDGSFSRKTGATALLPTGYTGADPDADVHEALVVKLMTDRTSWLREIKSRHQLRSASDSIVSIAFAATTEPPALSDPAAINLRHFSVEARSTPGAELMERYPFAIVLPKADRNLFEIIQSERLAASSLGEIRGAAAKIAKCIDALHQLGVAHGDIEPRNILRTDGNRYRLIDFDMSFAPSDASFATARLPGNHATAEKLQGTSAYVSPELLRWVEASDINDRPMVLTLSDAVQNDIWSFGCSLFEMATGSPLLEQAYDQCTPAAVQRLLGWTGITPSEETQIRSNHQDTAPLVELLRWCLACNAADRPKSMAEVVNHAFFVDVAAETMREDFVISQLKELLELSRADRPYQRVMVSYAWANSTFVINRLCMALAPLVRGMWLDRLGAGQGMGEWADASMENGVANADVVIAVVSREYVASKNCGYEMDLCAKYNKPVIPLMLGLPFQEWCDLTMVGETKLTNQFHNSGTGDMNPFIDFTDKSQFETKFHTELSPRLLISHRVPREVNREHLTRIAWLGDGHFGEVWQYTVGEPFSHVPPYPVAAKTLKADQAVDDAREVLLKEASMSATFEHRNVVKLVGVVTIPRDVPVLILFEFCANRRLDTYIRERGSVTIGTSMILTFCAEVLRGLEYVAGLRVIHRDVALRNVLLDSLGICKLSDFGDACGFGDEVDLPLNQLPLPWASVELLQASPSFSVHSDVWAAGVLMWEAFSDAAVPYRSDVDNLAELADFVEQGGRLAAPPIDICPSDVFEKLLKPCWATNPGNRPDFSELYNIAVRYGAQEDEQALEERRDQAFEERCARQANANTRRLTASGGAPLPILPILVRSASHPPTFEAFKAGRAVAVADGGASAKQPKKSDKFRFSDDMYSDVCDSDDGDCISEEDIATAEAFLAEPQPPPAFARTAEAYTHPIPRRAKAVLLGNTMTATPMERQHGGDRVSIRDSMDEADLQSVSPL